MKGREFVFHYFHLVCYKYDKTNLNCGGSYIDSINKRNNKCFQYAVTVVLNHEEMEKYLQRITKIKPFMNRYN